jgi:hypothetical protein
VRLLTFLLVLIATYLAALGTPQSARAVQSIRVETKHSVTPNGKPAVALSVNGQLVAQLAKEQRGRPPLECISAAAALITRAYREGHGELTIQAVDDSGRRYALYLDGKLLLLATDEEGKAWGAEPKILASTWLANLRQAWGLQQPAAPGHAGAADGREGRTARPAVAGGGASPQNPPGTGLLDVGTSAVRADPDYSKLIVYGGQPVYAPPGSTQLSQPVMPERLTARVTGSRVPSQAVWDSVENALRVYAALKQSATLRWQVAGPGASSLALGPGEQRKLHVAYTTDGSDPAASAQGVDLTLVNQSIAVPRETLTFFSNHPEGVTAPQLLYHADLPAGQAGRLVLHHQNQSRGELKVIARLVNTHGEACAVHIVPGTCPPDINTFYVGFRSAEVFWQNLNQGNGYVLAIPPGRQVLISAQRLPPGYTASGYFKLTNLGRYPLRLETVCMDPWMAPPEVPFSGDDRASQSVFPAPYVSISEKYDAGDDWLYLRLGKESPDSLVDGSRFDGSYGVTYSFDVQLRNPKADPALIFVVLRASAGEVKGQFFIDDEYVATPLIAGGEEQLLKEIPLKPGQTKLLKIRALPLNGGFYPASIILRETRYP